MQQQNLANSFKNGRYTRQEKLGQGTCGAVYKGYDTLKKMVVAIRIQSTMDQHELQLMRKFEEYYKTMGFNNVINIYEVIQEPRQIILIMDYAQSGDLFNYQQTVQKQNQAPMKDIMLQIANGLRELHQLNYVHRDMKPENILVSYKQDGQPCFKVADFGLSKSAAKTQTTKIGTPYYMAPELIKQNQKYGLEVDIWALGCIYYELITGNTLIQGTHLTILGNSVEELMKKINDAKQDEIDKKIDLLSKYNIIERERKLLKLMISINPQRRPKIIDVLQTFFGSDTFTNEAMQRIVPIVNPNQPQPQIYPQMEQIDSYIYEYNQFANQIEEIQKQLNQYPVKNEMIDEEFKQLNTYFLTNKKHVDIISQSQDQKQISENIEAIQLYIKQLNEQIQNIKLNIQNEQNEQKQNKLKQQLKEQQDQIQKDYEVKLRQQEENLKQQRQAELEKQQKQLDEQFKQQQFTNEVEKQQQYELLKQEIQQLQVESDRKLKEQQEKQRIDMQEQMEKQINESRVQYENQKKQLESQLRKFQETQTKQINSYIQDFKNFEIQIKNIQSELNQNQNQNEQIKSEFLILHNYFQTKLIYINRISQSQDQTQISVNIEAIKQYIKQLNEYIYSLNPLITANFNYQQQSQRKEQFLKNQQQYLELFLKQYQLETEESLQKYLESQKKQIVELKLDFNRKLNECKDQINYLEQQINLFQQTQIEYLNNYIQEYIGFEKQIQVIEQQLNEFHINNVNILTEYEILKNLFQTTQKDVIQMQQQQNQIPILKNSTVSENIKSISNNIKTIQINTKQLNEKTQNLKIIIQNERISIEYQQKILDLVKNQFVQSKVELNENIKLELQYLNQILKGKSYLQQKQSQEYLRIQKEYEDEIIQLDQFDQFQDFKKVQNEIKTIKLKSKQLKQACEELLFSIKQQEITYQYEFLKTSRDNMNTT